MMEKLTIFYQKLLQNLAKEYANDDFRGHTHFIQTYEMIADTLYGFIPIVLVSQIVHEDFTKCSFHYFKRQMCG